MRTPNGFDQPRIEWCRAQLGLVIRELRKAGQITAARDAESARRSITRALARVRNAAYAEFVTGNAAITSAVKLLEKQE